MKRFTALKEDVQRLVRAEPGRRFTGHYRQHRLREGRRESALRSGVFIAFGLLLLLCGLLLSIPPGVPGFLLWLPGLVLMVARLKGFAVLLDRSELAVRKLLGKYRPKR